MMGFWAEKLLTISVVVALNLTFVGIGIAFLKAFKKNYDSKLVELVTAFGLGAGITGTFTFAIAATIGISQIVLFSIFAILTPFLFYSLIHFWKFQELCTFFRCLRFVEKTLFLFVVILFLYNLYRGLWPDVDFDSTWYHLTEPKLYLEWEKMRFIPGGLLYYSAMPQLIEMLYLLAMAVKGGIAAKLIHTFFGFWCFVLTFLWGRKLSKSVLGGLASGLIFYASNIIFWESTNAYIDLAVTFFISLGLFYFFESLDKVSKKRELSLSSIFIGFAIGAKLLSIYFVGIIGLVNLMYGIFYAKKSVKTLFQESIIIGLVPIMFWFPWGLYSFFYTDNPVHPLMEGIFNDNDWFSQTQLGGLSRIKWLKEMTINLVKLPTEILTFDYGFSPVLIYGFIASILVFIKKRKTAVAAILIGLFVLFWNFTPARGGRFFLPITLIMSVYAGYALAKLSEKSNLQLFAVYVLIITNSLLQIGTNLRAFAPNVWVYSRETEESFLKTNVSKNIWGFYDYSGEVKEITGDSKVLVYNIHNLYHLDINFDELSYIIPQINGSEVYDFVRTEYSYVLIKRSNVETLAQEMDVNPPDLERLLGVPVYTDEFSQINLYKTRK